MLKPIQREAIRTFVLGKDVLYPFPRVMVNPLVTFSLTRVRPLARLAFSHTRPSPSRMRLNREGSGNRLEYDMKTIML